MRQGTGLKVTHKRFGKGEMFSFNPSLSMSIVFQRIGYMVISTTKKHMEEVTLDGKPLNKLVDRKDPLWYPDYRCAKQGDIHYV